MNKVKRLLDAYAVAVTGDSAVMGAVFIASVALTCLGI